MKSLKLIATTIDSNKGAQDHAEPFPNFTPSEFGTGVIDYIFSYTITHAQENSYKASFSQNKESIAVNVLVGQSRVINFDRPVGRFSVSNPEIAEAVLVTPDQVLVNGKSFGQVNFIAWEQSGGQFLSFDVYVRANLSLIDSQIRALFPKDDIRLSQANGSVVMSGSVADARTAAQVQSVVEAAGFQDSQHAGFAGQGREPGTTAGSRRRSESQQTARLWHFLHRTSTGRNGGYVNSGGGPSILDSATTGPTSSCSRARSRASAQPLRF